MTENAHGRPLTPIVRPRPAEPLRAAPVAPYPVVLVETRVVSRQALVSYLGNRYSVPPELADARVEVTQRLGGDLIDVVTAGGITLARHRLVADKIMHSIVVPAGETTQPPQQPAHRATG